MRSLPIGWNTFLAKLGFKRKQRKQSFGRNPLSRSLRLESLEDRRVLAVLTVNTDADALSLGANAPLTLREAVAIVQAGNTAGVHATKLAQINTSGGFTNNTILFASSLNNDTIELDLALGHISYSRSSTSLTIDASALDSLTIDANDPTPGHTGHGIRIFNITDASNGTNPSLVTLVGLTLTGGDVGFASPNNGEGGAIRSEARLVIRDCIIEENEADMGGAIYVKVAGGGTSAREVLRIENSIIDENDAYTGGGIAVIVGSFGTTVNDKIVVSNTTISDNVSSFGNGAGIYAELYGAEMTITDNSSILFNQAGSGGGIYATIGDGAALTVTGAQFEGNDASNYGGGIYVGGPFGATNATVTISQTIFEDNAATLRGGGLFASLINSSLIVDQCDFFDNDALGSGFGAGGGVALELLGNTTAEISNSTFVDGDATFAGGGIFALMPTGSTSSLAVRDSIFEENIAHLGGGISVQMPGAGHLSAVGMSFKLERSLVKSNTASDKGGGVHVLSGSGGVVEIVDSVITGNRAGEVLLGSTLHPDAELGNAGGGIYAYLFTDQTAASLTISGTEISDNTAGQHGGGLAVFTKRQSPSSAISRVGVYNSTISGNEASHVTTQDVPRTGGGVHLAVWSNTGGGNGEEALDTWFQNTTITNNTAAQGGGIYSLLPEQHPERRNNARLTNTIVSGNRDHDDNPNNLYGSFNIADTVFNLIGSGNTIYNHITHAPAALRSDTPSGNLFTDNPQLAPLANNGGLTRSHRPLTGSPVIDRGSNDLAKIPFLSSPANALPYDQRGAGYPRIVDIPSVNNNGNNFTVDIGAHEVGLAKVVDVILDNPSWGRDPHSFAEVVPLGEQLRPFATQNVNTIQIRFSDHVRKRNSSGVLSNLTSSDGNLMELKQTIRNIDNSVTNSTVTASSFSYDAATATATWTFATPLTDGKYAIHLKAAIIGAAAGIVDATGNSLDADWFNDPGIQIINGISYPSWDNYTDDPKRPFITGNGEAGTEGGAFRFHFAILVGDYNGDGMVDVSDTVSSSNPYSDGNGDGLYSSSDTTVWNNNLNDFLPLRGINGGDLNDDEKVNGPDLVIWQTAYFGGVGGDIDGDGDADGADFILWQRLWTNQSAWYIDPATPPPGGLTVGAAPQVTNVIVSGSMSAHAPYSFENVVGSGAQLATVPVGLADTISIVFSENVNVSATSLFVVGLTTANLPALAEFSYDPLTFTATWRFEGWVLGDNYLLHLSDSITDTEGNFLDGEWTNPASITTTNSLVSTFPSGDGDSGGDFAFVVTLLAGDMNLDATVDQTDYDLFVASLTQGGGTLFVHGDFNGSGGVNNMDIIHFVNNWQTNLQDIFILADFDGDGDVDGADLNILNANYGLTGAAWEDGDLNGDGIVDDLDIDLAFAQYGLWLNWVA